MSTITENLQILKDNTLAIKNAIIDKGGTINGDITTWANSIANIPSGGYGGSSSGKGDVTFYDYDGTILYSFSKDEFLALRVLPPLPTHQGLICQGWGWEDIADPKQYIVKYGGKMDIGASYITDDGKTRLYIRIAAEGRMTVPLYFSQTVDNGVTIDWGDGETQTVSGVKNVSASHTYASIGDYCITLAVESGCSLGLGHSTSGYCVMGSTDNNGRVYCNMLQKVEIGDGIRSIDDLAFNGCSSLSYITIPHIVSYIGKGAFSGCHSLVSIVIPYSIRSISQQTFYGCLSLSHITFCSAISGIGDEAFSNCYSLDDIMIPIYAITIIGIGAFRNCQTLNSIIIPTSGSFDGGSVFTGCLSLSSINIPSRVSSIGSFTFGSCISLSSVVIPKSVTKIESYAFKDCLNMAFYDFSNHTSVPTLSSTTAFQNIPTDCKIIVPDTLYDRWIAATNWSTYASYIIKKSDWDA